MHGFDHSLLTKRIPGIRSLEEVIDIVDGLSFGCGQLISLQEFSSGDIDGFIRIDASTHIDFLIVVGDIGIIASECARKDIRPSDLIGVGRISEGTVDDIESRLGFGKILCVCLAGIDMDKIELAVEKRGTARRIPWLGGIEVEITIQIDSLCRSIHSIIRGFEMAVLVECSLGRDERMHVQSRNKGDILTEELIGIVGSKLALRDIGRSLFDIQGIIQREFQIDVAVATDCHILDGEIVSSDIEAGRVASGIALIMSVIEGQNDISSIVA